MNSKSLYIHIPFCVRKCLFCSFVVSIAQEQKADDYVRLLIKEASQYKGNPVSTVYLGGGTPSILSEAQLTLLMQGLRQCFEISPGAEVSIEANPETITPQKLRTLKSLGFNRISLGVQSVNERFLKFLGRNHDASTALAAYKMLRREGFNNVNVDLMHGFPGQTMDELEADVRMIAALGGEHMSLYTLTIEPNSRFHAQQMKLDSDENIAQQYEFILKLLASYGYEQYEVSNFAKPGFESTHNYNYWLGGEYYALGVGAHGFLDGRRFWNVERLNDYIERVSQGESPVAGEERLRPETLNTEKIIFGLRTNRGININLIPLKKQPIIESLINDGFLVLEHETLKTTPQGRLVLDEISVRLI